MRCNYFKGPSLFDFREYENITAFLYLNVLLFKHLTFTQYLLSRKNCVYEENNF
ncbi:hypothetical protein TRIP_B350064 [uncultured Desulfatiglans sp.]|uniref:Uncharacterized protein n=1 Tax=Uncultured Desulfatiglans sp. TaxID=1748965 RepID=A0A653AA60_UNCDX|nr:hypothetical protein TRIP_B350064 [uncultured Desulfatiglans sp.]